MVGFTWNMRFKGKSLYSEKRGGNRIGTLAVRANIEGLYNKTGFELCQKILEKIRSIEELHKQDHPAIEGFINQNKERLQTIASLSKEEFADLNAATPLADVLLEREILRKFSAGQKP